MSQTRLLGCDCFLSTVLLDDHGAPLDAKPGKRLVTPEQRVALIARDRGCAFPGCTCVPAWTDAHHIRHWANGGPTVMNNLVLLCRSHHRLMHRKSGVRREVGDSDRCRQQTVVHPATLDRPAAAPATGEHHLQNLRGQTSLATTEHGPAPHRGDLDAAPKDMLSPSRRQPARREAVTTPDSDRCRACGPPRHKATTPQPSRICRPIRVGEFRAATEPCPARPACVSSSLVNAVS